MASQARKLSDKINDLYEDVVRDEQGETVLEAVQKVESIAAQADSVEALRQAIDVENAHLQDVIATKAKLQETVGSLIAGYDALTNALGGEIDSMKEMTLKEKLVAFFSADAAKRMRERRVQEADIETQLQDLVSQTQAIGGLLSGHAEVLNREYSSVGAKLEQQQDEVKAATETFEASDRELDELNTQISEGREKMAELTGTARADADRELQQLINRANEVTERRNTSLSNAQTH